jgi:hypothetical protein
MGMATRFGFERENPTMTNPPNPTDIITDCDADAGDRLIAMMTLRGLTYRDNLIGAARKAGEQLELWKPMALIPKTFLHASAIVPADPGSVLIVLANADRTLTIRMLQPPPGFTRRQLINDLADMARRHYAQDGEIAVDKGSAIFVTDFAVDKWGGAPGTKTGGMPDNASMNLLGLLFAAIQEDGRQSLLDLLEDVIARGLCPAMVGLVGPGSEHVLCGVWPLVLPLARYLDAVEHALG